MLGAIPASAQAPAPPADPIVQTAAASLMEDAAAYAAHYGVSPDEALRRLRAQEASVATVDRLAALYADRLAGVVIEHDPDYRIVFLLTGAEPVADDAVPMDGASVPILFRTGAPATRAQILDAIRLHQADLRVAVPHPPGMGVDARAGTLAVMVRAADIDPEGADAMADRLGAIAGVPVQIHGWDDLTGNSSVAGGSRVAGIDPADGRRYVCTTGFVVTDGVRTGVTTAAHCPDALSLIAPGERDVPLTMIGAWGARYQDVQIHVSTEGTGEALAPLFHADTAKHTTRALTSWRNRASTRVGDFVCHHGERTGYSCAEVAFVDYAPPGDLCAGPCEPLWVAVQGPTCKSGDSGGPVFLGTIAFGTVKGSSYAADGSCRVYYYMSTDYLPPGWTLLHQ